QVGVRPRAGPGDPRPALGELGGRAPAARRVGALRAGPHGGLAALGAPGVLERDADIDGEVAVARLLDVGGAPVGAAPHVGVLVVGGVPVGLVEDRPRGPVPAHHLALDGAGDVGGEGDVVVLVGLVDDPVLPHPQEVDGDVEVLGGEVGEPVGG